MTTPKVCDVPTGLRRSLVAIDDIKPLAKNPRRGKVELTKASLEAHGQHTRLLVRVQTREILKGNHTWLGARELGWTHVAVEWRDEPDDDRARALAIADNKASDESEWDLELLAEDLTNLPTLDGTLFTQADLDGVLKDAEKLAATAERADLADPPVPDQPRNAVTKDGDLWQLGDQRLLCGDSRKRADIDRVLAGRAVDLILTSPPYNVGVPYQDHDDRELPWPDYRKGLIAAVSGWMQQLATGRFVAWNVGVAPRIYHARQLVMLEDDLGLKFRRQIVWDKMGQGLPLFHHTQSNPVARNYAPNHTHEVVFLLANGKPEHGGAIEPDSHGQHSVIKVSPSTATRDVPAGDQAQGTVNPGLNRSYGKAHGAVMPTNLARPLIVHLAAPGELVADPFCGAGTTLLAAHQLDRHGAGIELSPKYCDVAIERWETLTGGKAKRVKRPTGRKKR